MIFCQRSVSSGLRSAGADGRSAKRSSRAAAGFEKPPVDGSDGLRDGPTLLPLATGGTVLVAGGRIDPGADSASAEGGGGGRDADAAATGSSYGAADLLISKRYTRRRARAA